MPCPHARPSWQSCPHCLGLNQELLVYPCGTDGVEMEGPPELLSSLNRRLGGWRVFYGSDRLGCFMPDMLTDDEAAELLRAVREDHEYTCPSQWVRTVPLTAWRCNPLPAVFVTVAALSAESARRAAQRRMGFSQMDGGGCGVERCYELDGEAAGGADGTVLRIEEY